MRLVAVIGVVIFSMCCLPVRAECPLDHFIIGCNRDGIEGTEDDNTLFLDCQQKYRNSGQTLYENWFYPLRKSIFTGYPYRIGEPGFDVFQADDPQAGNTYDPNRALAGSPDLDYRITVEVVALSAGLRAVHKDYPQFTLDSIGQSFDHSSIHSLRGDSHIHMSYQADTGDDLQWITFRVYDSLEDGDRYEPSEPVTIVFNVEPMGGDLRVDNRVETADMLALSRHWLSPESSKRNDYCERADTDRDGFVDFFDFARLAMNWRTQAR
jgi:hypothetical protein